MKPLSGFVRSCAIIHLKLRRATNRRAGPATGACSHSLLSPTNAFRLAAVLLSFVSLGSAREISADEPVVVVDGNEGILSAGLPDRNGRIVNNGIYRVTVGGSVAIMNLWGRNIVSLEGGKIQICDLSDRSRLLITSGEIGTASAFGSTTIDVRNGRAELLETQSAGSNLIVRGGQCAVVEIHNGTGQISGGSISSLNIFAGIAKVDGGAIANCTTFGGSVEIRGGAVSRLSLMNGTVNVRTDHFQLWMDNSAHITGALINGVSLNSVMWMNGGNISLFARDGLTVTSTSAQWRSLSAAFKTTPPIAFAPPAYAGNVAPVPNVARAASPFPKLGAAKTSVAALGIVCALAILIHGMRSSTRICRPSSFALAASALLIVSVAIAELGLRSYEKADFLARHNGKNATDFFSNGCSIGFWRGPDYVLGDPGRWGYQRMPGERFQHLRGQWAADLGGGEYFICLPCWFLSLLALSLPSIWFAKLVRGYFENRKRMRAGCCASCGYDLRATLGRCPECGSSVPSCLSV